MNIIGFVISLALFIGGLFMMGYSFYVTGFEGVVFVGGILVTSAGVALPIHLLKRIDA